MTMKWRLLVAGLVVCGLGACSDDAGGEGAAGEGGGDATEDGASTDASGDDAEGDATMEDASTDDASMDDASMEDVGADAEADVAEPDVAEPDVGGADAGSAWSCEQMAALFVNTPDTVDEVSCGLADGTTATCCQLTFGSDIAEDGPYCPESLTSPPPYGLSVYDGATNPGLRAFNGAYLQDIEADGYDPMVDDAGNTNIVTSLAGPPPSGGSNCLAIDQDFRLTITVNVPLNPTMAAAPSTIASVENLGVSIYGVPSTGEPPSATMGPGGGPGGGGPGGPGGGTSTGINVPSIGACGAHPDPAGYLHDHFVPQVMNRVLEANGIGANEVECTRYEQSESALYGFAKDGYPIYASRESDGSLPADLDACNGQFGPTPEFPEGIYHYHASETRAPNFMDCLSGVPVRDSFQYR